MEAWGYNFYDKNTEFFPGNTFKLVGKNLNGGARAP